MNTLLCPKNVKIALWSPFRGKVGTERAVVNYARSLKEIGFDVVIIQLLDEFEDYKDEFRLIRVWPKSMDFIGKSNFLYRRDFYILGFISTRRLIKILKIENFDIAFSFLMAVPLIKAIKKNKCKSIKLILSIQGFPKFFLRKDNLLSKLENKLREYFWIKNYQSAHKILLMTEHTKQLITLKFPDLRQKFSVLENPLFDDSRKHASETRNESAHKIFFVGRYSYQKDFELFSEATRILAQNPVSNLEFHVFGNFPDKIRSACENRHLNFRGYEQDFWYSLSGKNDIHLITARWEDPGHAMLEGLAFGHKTIVVERVSPHVDLARSFELPVVPSDPKVLASHIAEIIETPHYNEKSAQISRLVLDVYGFVNFKQKISNIINDTMV